MPTVQEKIAQAKAAGYTDDQIASHLAETPEYGAKIKTATAAGYKASDIVGHLSDAAPTKPATEQPGMLATAAGALGKGFGSTVLGAQKLVGKGLSAVGGLTADTPTLTDLVTGNKPTSMLAKAGKWLQDDANQGQAKLTAELAPYKAANPTTAAIGETGGEIIATLPVGGVLGAGVKAALPVAAATRAAPLINAISSSGMRTGLPAATTLAGKAVDLGARAIGGGITGGASAALVDPDHATTGAVVGAALPGAIKLAGVAGNALSSAATSGAQRLMQSAIKPTIAQLRDGSAQTAVDTLLKYGINPNAGGVNKLRDLIGGLNDQIGDKIATSGAVIDKQKVLNALADVRNKFTTQVSPTADLGAIQKVADDFATHPSLPTNDIPVTLAQQLKQGTYKVLSKKYGQVGTAETEAQKGLARGLKDEIATAVPEVGALNAEESRLISTLKVSERRALMELNKNPVGLAGLAKNPVAWAAMMADKSSLFKALAARAVNASADAPAAAANMLARPAANRLLQSSAPIIASDR